MYVIWKNICYLTYVNYLTNVSGLKIVRYWKNYGVWKMYVTLEVRSVDSFWRLYIKIWFCQVVEHPLGNIAEKLKAFKSSFDVQVWKQYCLNSLTSYVKSLKSIEYTFVRSSNWRQVMFEKNWDRKSSVWTSFPWR